MLNTERAGPSAELRPWDPPLVVLIRSLLYPLVAALSLWLALLVCSEPLRKPYLLTAILAFIATADVMRPAPLHALGAAPRSNQSLAAIAVRWVLVISFVWALMTVSGLQAFFSPRVWAAWTLLAPPLLWLSRVGMQSAFGLATAKNRIRPANAIIVGANHLGRLLESKLHQDLASGIRIMGYFDDPQLQEPGMTAAHFHEIRELRRFIRTHDVRLVYIAWPMARERRILELLEVLQDSTVSIYFVPDVSIINIIQGRLALVNGIPLVGVCESPVFGLREVQKRLFDVVMSLTLLVILAPLLVAIAAGISCTSPGPILFRQRRYGLDGREFMVYKFRSMSVVEDGSSIFSAAERGDGRITPIGALLRKTSLDELPQLFNVLGGSMSLVGPRPHVVAMNEAYRRVISGYMLRHKVRPGITGWAQVNGSRGGNDLEEMRRRVQLDLEYLKHWSLKLDIIILLRTAALVCSDRHAY